MITKLYNFVTISFNHGLSLLGRIFLFMPDFIKKNKLALICLLVFICLALASGFYLSAGKENKNIPKAVADRLEQFLPKTIFPSQSIEEKSTPEEAVKDVVATTAVTKIGEATATTSITERVGSKYTLLVGDKQYDINLAGKQTVYDLMMALKNRGDFDFKGKGTAGLGFFVEAINGIENNSFKNIFWFYYINSKSANVGISNYVLKPNDLISWKYETSQF